MARPSIDPTTLVNGQEGWDAVLRDIVNALTQEPLPVAQYANLAALPDAALYDRCMATTSDDDALYWSVGGAWKEVTVAP